MPSARARSRRAAGLEGTWLSRLPASEKLPEEERACARRADGAARVRPTSSSSAGSTSRPGATLQPSATGRGRAPASSRRRRVERSACASQASCDTALSSPSAPQDSRCSPKQQPLPSGAAPGSPSPAFSARPTAIELRSLLTGLLAAAGATPPARRGASPDRHGLHVLVRDLHLERRASPSDRVEALVDHALVAARACRARTTACPRRARGRRAAAARAAPRARAVPIARPPRRRRSCR